MTRAERLKAFGEALQGAMRSAGINQRDLAEMIGNTSQGGVSGWVTGKSAPDTPDDVFAIERALEVVPGSLSRHLGFLPPDAVRVAAAFEEVVADDPQLDDEDRSFLLNAYRMALKNRAARGRGRPKG